MIRKDFPKLGEHYFEERLPNGLLVRVMEKPGFAKRYAFVAADYGSIDAEFFLNGKKYTTPQGVAHYLEHKMFDLPEGNAMQEFAKYAGANNAFTSYTMTAYYVECTEHLEENFEILLRMVTTGYFTDESVQKERGIIAQEIKMYEDSADSAVMENLFRIMYQNHPVRNNIAGTVESIEEITADTLKLCHDAFYDPSNLIVCVIGDVDAASIIEQARKLTPAGKKPQFERCCGAPEPAQVPVRTIEKQMEIAMPAFAIGFRCPDAGRGADAQKLETLGVRYMIRKPCKLQAVAACVRKMLAAVQQMSHLSSDAEALIDGVLRELGVPGVLKGCRYLREAALLAAGDLAGAGLEEIYARVAKASLTPLATPSPSHGVATRSCFQAAALPPWLADACPPMPTALRTLLGSCNRSAKRRFPAECSLLK